MYQSVEIGWSLPYILAPGFILIRDIQVLMYRLYVVTTLFRVVRYILLMATRWETTVCTFSLCTYCYTLGQCATVICETVSSVTEPFHETFLCDLSETYIHKTIHCFVSHCNLIRTWLVQ